MIENVEYRLSIKGELLDEYLLHGWYRMGGFIFTTHFIEPFNDGREFRVYWLRYDVNKITLTKTSKQILARAEQFSVTCKPLLITEELEELHSRYTKSLKFSSYDNLAYSLGQPNIFDSYLVEIRDAGKLIGAGILDLGRNTIAGIKNIYDPEYKKHSPGKLLILHKYLYCMENNIQYYYPGYYMPDHPLFDYKLFIDEEATDVYIPEHDIWVGYRHFVAARNAIQ